MSVGYQAVSWNRQKYVYDGVLIGSVLAYLGAYVYLAPQWVANAEPMNMRIRAYGSAALLLLHVILSIGPLCRLDRRFLPLLYNRRHMGVTMAVLGLLHADVARTWYHAYSPVDANVSQLATNVRFDSLSQFPFELLGIGALLIVVLMAATSHDFWLANLTAPVWKGLHMLVYVAYALLIAHVALGALQTHVNPLAASVVGVGVAWVVGLHAAAAYKEREPDQSAPAETDRTVFVARFGDIPDGRARVVFAGGERIAVFRQGRSVSAISAVCQHQNGPLGEGQIIDGLVTCPWHGFQYRAEDGRSPAPFTECVPTFDVQLRGDRVYVDPRPHPAGTRVEPAQQEDA